MPDLIQSLEELAITDEDDQPVTRANIEIALRNAFYRVDRASEYLLAHTGQFPKKPGLNLSPNEKIQVQELRRAFPRLYPATILQVYSAVEKNKDAAAALLVDWVEVE
jgi:hypothetical protein